MAYANCHSRSRLKVTDVHVPFTCTEPDPSLPAAYVLLPTSVALDRVMAGLPSRRAESPAARPQVVPSVVTWKLPRDDRSDRLGVAVHDDPAVSSVRIRSMWCDMRGHTLFAPPTDHHVQPPTLLMWNVGFFTGRLNA